MVWRLQWWRWAEVPDPQFWPRPICANPVSFVREGGEPRRAHAMHFECAYKGVKIKIAQDACNLNQLNKCAERNSFSFMGLCTHADP